MRQLDRETVNLIIDNLNKKFREYNRCYDVFNDYCGLCVDISWGDWKHDHWCADELTREVLDEMGYKYTITTQVTEEDGSDTYSATHVIRFM